MARTFQLPDGKVIEFTPEQEAIADAAAAGQSLSVYAGAGTAKTTTLKMLSPGIRSPRVLALAFNVKIVKSLVEAMPQHFIVKTLNGLGHAAWQRQRGGKLELDKDKMNPIVTNVFKEMAPELLSIDEDRSMWSAVRGFANLMRRNSFVPRNSRGRGPRFQGPPAEEYLDEFIFSENVNMKPEVLLRLSEEVVFRSIEQAFNRLIDFDDQIYMSTTFFCQYDQFDVVLVDEAQDLSPQNHRQLMLCKPRQLIAVGDPKQAIYAFRGADHNSMANLEDTARRELGLLMERFPLATTFRCPKAIVARQKEHYPEYSAAESAPEGEVIFMEDWGVEDVKKGSAIICRNNAPLLSLAFLLLKNGRGFHFVGYDMAKNLKSLIKRIAGFSGKTLNKAQEEIPTDQLLTKMSLWYESEVHKINSRGKGEFLGPLKDRRECVRMILSKTKTLREAMNLCETIFEAKGEGVTLSTGHRAKGLEWEHIYHLDSFRIPSKYALTAAEQGDTSQLIQENNLRYVIETRAKHSLSFLSLENNSDTDPVEDD